MHAMTTDVPPGNASQLPAADVNVAITAIGRALKQLAGSKIEVTFGLDGKASQVQLSQRAIEQVVMTLATNACDAMPAGGTLIIATYTRTQYGAGTPATGRRAQYKIIEVVDTGSGIPPHVKARIFEPSFTTKAGGAGLGLYTASEIVQRGGGHLEMDSEVGRGTAFRVLLPIVEE